MDKPSKTDTLDTLLGFALIGAAIGGVALLRSQLKSTTAPAQPVPPQPVTARPPSQPVRQTSHNAAWDAYIKGSFVSVQSALNAGHGFASGQDDPNKTYAPIRNINGGP